MNSSLQGIWAFSGSSDQSQEDYLHIFEDGRMVQLNQQPQPVKERHLISLRGYPQDDGTFRIKTRQDTTGYVVHIHLADGHLEIIYPDKTLTGRSVHMHELPTWYADELAKITRGDGET